MKLVIINSLDTSLGFVIFLVALSVINVIIFFLSSHILKKAKKAYDEAMLNSATNTRQEQLNSCKCGRFCPGPVAPEGDCYHHPLGPDPKDW